MVPLPDVQKKKCPYHLFINAAVDYAGPSIHYDTGEKYKKNKTILVLIYSLQSKTYWGMQL